MTTPSIAADGTPGAGTLSFRGISKRFRSVQALEDVSFDVELGSVHAVVGANGAGKSTLMHILAGVQRCDAGSISIAGEQLPIGHAGVAGDLGVAVVYQELSLFPDLDVASNIAIEREPRRLGLIRKSGVRTLARDALRLLQADIEPDVSVAELRMGDRQLVEIARALSRNARIIVLDEPNSALTSSETEVLRAAVQRLRARGVTFLLVSHRLDDVFAMSDRISVLRDGRHVQTTDTADTTVGQIVDGMVGELRAHDAQRSRARRLGDGDPVRLEARGLTVAPHFRDVALTVRRGEIVGIAGLEGSGATELLDALFGIHGPCGRIAIDGREVRVRDPATACANGIALVPRDRRGEGLFPDMGLRENVGMPSLGRLSRGPFMSAARDHALADEMIASLRIAASGGEQNVLELSGGNQQKVVIGKWLGTRPSVLLLNDPTRGIDVGAKDDVHALLRRLADEGLAVVITSSEFDEIVSVADRILVLYRGDVVGELRPDAPQAGARLRSLATTGTDDGGG